MNIMLTWRLRVPPEEWPGSLHGWLGARERAPGERVRTNQTRSMYMRTVAYAMPTASPSRKNPSAGLLPHYRTLLRVLASFLSSVGGGLLFRRICEHFFESPNCFDALDPRPPFCDTFGGHGPRYRLFFLDQCELIHAAGFG